ncbi:hypothetical protein CXB51_000862 [Gossypium anomalum]|uniref:Piwi domain-containing protein n=1 Tax=Gossypium anomalum TaxID=47600 RepID=A0A8J6DD24_9ROSI|nr:hypothetical protein CXB51_000862 [Gossypium anomalum]
MLTLGQTPSIPVVSKVPTIIFGMGALFGFPEQSGVPSIAVMILSSKPISDKVDDGIMKEALLDFYTSSGKKKPDQIIIFRDGVSESQFNQVLTKLLRLASSLTRSRTLKIVVIVVRKTIIPSFFSRDLLTMCYMTKLGFRLMICKSLFILYPICIKGAPQPYFWWLLFATLIRQLHSWRQFMKIRDSSETSSSHGGMYALGVISVPQLSRLKDKVSNFILVC